MGSRVIENQVGVCRPMSARQILKSAAKTKSGKPVGPLVYVRKIVPKKKGPAQRETKFACRNATVNRDLSDAKRGATVFPKRTVQIRTQSVQLGKSGRHAAPRSSAKQRVTGKGNHAQKEQKFACQNVTVRRA